MDLPSEILHMIFRRVFYEPRLRLRFLKRSRTLIIPSPRSVLVSQKFFEYSKAAKAAVLPSATVVLDEEAFQQIHLPIITRPDFSLVQDLTAQNCWNSLSIRTLKVIFDSAPRLRRLTVQGPSIWACGNYVDWTSISHIAQGDFNWYTAVPGPNFQQDIKQAVEDNLRRSFHARQVLSYPQVAVALDAWLSRNKEFELCFDFRVLGLKYFRAYRHPYFHRKDRHLWVSEHLGKTQELY